MNPGDPWAWAGLAGDIVDLVPFVTGVGEAIDAVATTRKIVKNADNALDAAKNARKATSAHSAMRKSTGSYEILFIDNYLRRKIY